MTRKYQDLKPIIGQFSKVLVTGPHGAGNKIAANIIAMDFDLPYHRGENTWYHSEYNDSNIDVGLVTYHETMKNKQWSMFAPSQAAHLHNILEYLDDVLVVFMYKSLNEIKDYSVRNSFVKNSTHLYEISTRSQIIEKDFSDLDFLKNWSVEEATYFLWEVKQKKSVKNYIELEHNSLSDHKLWVSKEDRRHFKEWQIKDDEKR
jgi:hypothetical protein